MLGATVAATSGITVISIEMDHGWDFVALSQDKQHPASPQKNQSQSPPVNVSTKPTFAQLATGFPKAAHLVFALDWFYEQGPGMAFIQSGRSPHTPQ
jgi:hypothetical protein